MTKYRSDRAAGAMSLQRESKLGQAVTLLGSIAALATVEWLSEIDLSTWPGALRTVGGVVIGTAIGTLTAYTAKNEAG